MENNVLDLRDYSLDTRENVLTNSSFYRYSIFAFYKKDSKIIMEKVHMDYWGAGEYKGTFFKENNIDKTYNVKDLFPETISIYIPFLSFSTLEKALVFTKVLQKEGIKIKGTVIGYMSYGRQERETETEPELLSIILNPVLSKLVNPIFLEPHTSTGISTDKEVSVIRRLYDLFIPSSGLIVAPDKGCASKLKSLCIKPDIVIDKQRKDGNVISTIKEDNVFLRNYRNTETEMEFYILDDICDGGRTFMNVADIIKEKYPNAKIYLCVAHCIIPFGTKLLKEKLDGIIAIDTCFEGKIYDNGFVTIKSLEEIL